MLQLKSKKRFSCWTVCVSATCDGGCWNGGECTAVNGEAKCICSSSWTGSTCQHGAFSLINNHFISLQELQVLYLTLMCCLNSSLLCFCCSDLSAGLQERGHLRGSGVLQLSGGLAGRSLSYRWGTIYSCDGVRMSKLNLFVSAAAVCSQSCLNGGKCISPNKCRCRPSFSGPRCEERKKSHWSSPNILSYFWLLICNFYTSLICFIINKPVCYDLIV